MFAWPEKNQILYLSISDGLVILLLSAKCLARTACLKQLTRLAFGTFSLYITRFSISRGQEHHIEI